MRIWVAEHMGVQEKDDWTDEDVGFLITAGMRALRALGYSSVAALLISAIDYELKGEWAIVVAIGLLGLFTSSARIGQLGVIALLVMALISPEVVQAFLRQ